VPKLKMRETLTLLLQYVFMLWCLIKHWMRLQFPKEHCIPTVFMRSLQEV